MSPPPSPFPPVLRWPAVSAANPTAELRQHLNSLSIFHFVHTGFSLFLLIIPLYLLFFGLVAAFADTHPAPGVTYMGWVVLVMSVVLRGSDFGVCRSGYLRWPRIARSSAVLLLLCDGCYPVSAPTLRDGAGRLYDRGVEQAGSETAVRGDLRMGREWDR
jgi:hypothetical protein